jgi:hypothetical protein
MLADSREELSWVVGDDYLCGRQPLELMTEHEPSFLIDIIGDDATSPDFAAFAVCLELEHFEHLACF